MAPEIFIEIFLVGILAGALRLATPVLFASIGEIYSERSGVLNLGLEGIMEATAFIAFLTCYFTGSPWLGVLAAILVGCLIALIHSFLCVKIGINQVISGLLIVTFGTGVAFFGYRGVFGAYAPTVKIFESINIPGLSQIPVIGPILFRHNILVYLALFLAIIFGVILYKTTLGLKIRAVGEDPRACDTLGINVNRIRHSCVVLSGAMTGFGGAFLTVGFMGIYGQGMVAGRGWLAIIVTIFSRWSPYRAILGSLLIGFAYSLAIGLIGAGVGIPYHLLLTMPFIAAVIVISFLFKGAKGPSALLIPYRRE